MRIGSTNRLCVALLFCAALFSEGTWALSGEAFLQKCQRVTVAPEKGESPQEIVNRALDAGSCAGFVGGAIKGINLVGNMLLQKKLIKHNFICLPQGVQANTLLAELVNHLASSPPEMEAPVQMHLFNLFIKEYGCKPAK